MRHCRCRLGGAAAVDWAALPLNTCSLQCHFVSNAKMGKRAQEHRYYARGDATHGPRRCAVGGLSRISRQRVAVAFGHEGEDLDIADTSHLLVNVDAPLRSGGSIQVAFYDPVRMVQHVIDHSRALRKAYGEKLQEHPSPWRIVLGFDEQTPGSKVNHNNQRKNMCMMFNFLELGADVLEVDATWFVPMVIRPTLFEKLDGGWSNVLKHFLRRMLLGPQSFTAAGVLVPVFLQVETSYQLQASLGSLLTDGEGWMKALQWNGHSSMRPCWRHANVFKKNAGMVDTALGYVDITCSDVRSLRLWKPAQFFRTLDEVLEARRSLGAGEHGWTNTRLKAVIKSAGFSPTPTGLLADLDLRRQVDFLRVCAYDWMHTTFQDGWMSNAMWLISEAISIARRGNTLCEDFIAHLRACQFPLSRASAKRTLERLFDPLMVRKHNN